MSAIREYWVTGLLIWAVSLGGCVVKDVGQTVEMRFKGDYYLTSEKYREGRQSFAAEVAGNPGSALAHYYYGRFLLHEEDYKLALDHLDKARTLDAGNADYQFWAGAAYGALKDVVNEEACYRRALERAPEHLQALTYLGHLELRGKRYEEALELYRRALAIWPDSPSALYNRALILNRLGRSPEERAGWLAYLSRYPSGAEALPATEYLNALGDFTYRTHRLGLRTVTTEKIWFEPFSAILAPSSHPSLQLIGEVFTNLDQGRLQIVVYQKNNRELARLKAISIRDYLIDAWPGLDPARIGVSWFAGPQQETIRGTRLSIDESVSFFITAT